MARHNRAPGTGTLERRGTKVYAYAPEYKTEDGKRRRTHVLTRDTEHRAGKDLDAWLAANGKGAVAT